MFSNTLINNIKIIYNINKISEKEVPSNLGSSLIKGVLFCIYFISLNALTKTKFILKLMYCEEQLKAK